MADRSFCQTVAILRQPGCQDVRETPGVGRANAEANDSSSRYPGCMRGCGPVDIAMEGVKSARRKVFGYFVTRMDAAWKVGVYHNV